MSHWKQFVIVQVPMFREVFCIAKPEVFSEKAITEGDFAWLFHRYWNGNEVYVNSNDGSQWLIIQGEL